MGTPRLPSGKAKKEKPPLDPARVEEARALYDSFIRSQAVAEDIFLAALELRKLIFGSTSEDVGELETVKQFIAGDGLEYSITEHSGSEWLEEHEVNLGELSEVLQKLYAAIGAGAQVNAKHAAFKELEKQGYTHEEVHKAIRNASAESVRTGLSDNKKRARKSEQKEITGALLPYYKAQLEADPGNSSIKDDILRLEERLLQLKLDLD